MNLTTWKSLLGGVTLAPLITLPVTFLCSLLYWPFSMNQSFDLGGTLLIALVGLVIFSYPATLVLGLGIYFIAKKNISKPTPWVFVVPAFLLTALVANTELLEGHGFFGFLYLSCSTGCAWAFWYISIHHPNRVNQINKTP